MRDDHTTGPRHDLDPRQACRQCMSVAQTGSVGAGSPNQRERWSSRSC
jgi:hypothetical protein